MNKTRVKILEDMLIHKEKIKSEDSSLRLDCTSDDLRASITAIESNKLEQETSKKGKNIVLTAKKYWEPGHYDSSGKKVDFAIRMRLIDFIECEPNTEYYASRQTYILRGFDKERNATINFGAVNAGNTFTTDENTYLLGVAIDKVYDEYDEELDKVMICKNSETDKTWEKGYVDMPSLRYKSEVEGITGDVSLKVQNKNLAQNIKYLNQSTAIYPVIKCDIYYKKNKYYIVSFKTPDTGDTVYLNHGTGWGIRRVTSIYAVYCDGTRKFYIIQALETAFRKDINYINKTNQFLDKSTGLLSEFMIEEIDAITDEEALKCVYSNYVEHQEQDITISLGEKTLYKGDRIVRKNGKWYFDLKWAVINDFTNLIKNSTVDGLKRASITLSINIVNTLHLNFNQGYSNILNAVNNGATFNKKEGFTVGLLNNAGNPTLWIYINGFDNYTKEEYQQALNDLGAYFIIPFKENELELIEDENLIKQLDTILTCITEYDDVTNFDFDNDVTFEIEVEKDNIRLLNSRLDKAEANTTSATMIALEKEDN